ncbi:hypothetical protein [Paraburkholderia xenovorans]|uniref:DUF7940 domain-containing protein n=1 Tax=Paraburkholderia xenovorans TaxID=36873 RepID=UPI0015C52C10|nr:hypothetical protein [Paraburkholderia xenovorans]NPT39673.1 hypothetical protein [Paraburkholderia xenovorans]
MKPVSYWRSAHRRNSVRALMASTAVSFVGGVWSALPEAWIDRLPVWIVLSVPFAISAVGLVLAYLHQSSLEE